MTIIAGVRSLCLVLILASACDLRPAPKNQPGSGSAAAAVAPTPSPRLGAPVDSAACEAIGKHFAQVLIDTATDPAEKAVLEQERTRNVRRQGETCVANQWDENTRGCFLAAKTRIALQQCIASAPVPGGGGGSGSAR